MFNWDASIYSVSQFLNNFPDLPSFLSVVFSIDRWNMTALFVDNIQLVLNNNRSGRLEIILLQVTSYRAAFWCNLHPSYLPINLCSSYWVPGLYNYDR